jgi:hypothetical protein
MSKVWVCLLVATCVYLKSVYVCIAGSYVYLIELWQGSAIQSAIVQGTDIMFSIGSFFAPLLAVAFLVPLPDIVTDYGSFTGTSHTGDLLFNTTSSPVGNYSYSSNNNGSDVVHVAGVEAVRWAFVLSAAVWLCPAGVFALTLILSRNTGLTLVQRKSSKATSSSCLPTSQIGLLSCTFPILAAAFQLVLFATYSISIDYMQTFATVGLHWHVDSAAYLNVVCGVFKVIGHILAIVLSSRVELSSMIMCNVSIWTAGHVVIYLSSAALLPGFAMWIGASAAGLGYASMAPVIYLWVNKLVSMTSVQAATVTIGAYVGILLGSTLVSILFAEFGHMAAIYMAVAGCFLLCVLTAMLILCAKCLKSRMKV